MSIFTRPLFNIFRWNYLKRYNGLWNNQSFLCGTICFLLARFLPGQLISLCNVTYRANSFSRRLFSHKTFCFFMQLFFSGLFIFLWIIFYWDHLFMQRYFSRRFIFLWIVFFCGTIYFFMQLFFPGEFIFLWNVVDWDIFFWNIFCRDNLCPGGTFSVATLLCGNPPIKPWG